MQNHYNEQKRQDTMITGRHKSFYFNTIKLHLRRDPLLISLHFFPTHNSQETKMTESSVLLQWVGDYIAIVSTLGAVVVATQKPKCVYRPVKTTQHEMTSSALPSFCSACSSVEALTRLSNATRKLVGETIWRSLNRVVRRIVKS